MFPSDPESGNLVDVKIVSNRSQTGGSTLQRTRLIDGVIPGY